MLPSERSCQGRRSPGDPRGRVPSVLGHPKALWDAESSPGVLWAPTARKITLVSRTSSEPTGAVLEARGCCVGLCFGHAKFGWPMATRSPCHGPGGVGGQLSAWRACPLPAAAPALPAAELEHGPPQHRAWHQRAVQLHEPCHGGHSRRNVWGEYRSFCSRRRAEERGVVLRLCLPARRARHLAPAVLARRSRLWHKPS